MDNEFEGCTITLEQRREEIEALEKQLAEREGISGSVDEIRDTLVKPIIQTYNL